MRSRRIALHAAALSLLGLAAASCSTLDGAPTHRAGEFTRWFRAPSAGEPTTIFSALDLPAPNSVRSAAGVPGPDYWQQGADYTIQAELNPDTTTVTASETLTYTNNSPDTLTYLWFHLEQNLFTPDSAGSLMRNNPGRFGNRNPFRGGFTISSVKVNGVETPIAVYDTLGRVDLAQPLAPKGGSVRVDFSWSFTVPPYGADRTGIYQSQDGPVFQVAQWFPAVAVYDDVKGWNARPYLGQGEFYTNTGSFDVRLTVPRTHLVAATGVLQNPAEVLTPGQIERLARAAKNTATTIIRDENEIKDPSTRPPGAGPLTWAFKASNVRTVAWTSSAAFLWDAAGIDWGDGTSTLCQSLYTRDALPLWKEKSTDSLRFSIEHYSKKWFRYPYPVATNVNGIIGGMEYPMIIFCAERKDEHGLFGVTTHEIGHNWFPMTVNTDERAHAWMDEGFNSFINYYASLERFPDHSPGRGGARAFVPAMLEPDQQPIETHADQVQPGRLGTIEYAKTATGMVLLREVILGPDRFDAAFRRYVHAWAFKSPQPADFFRCMEDAAGTDLSWFWRGWFLGTGTLDQAIESVEPAEGGGVNLTLRNLGELVMPATVKLTFDDGSDLVRHIPVEAWFTSNRFTTHVDTGARKVTSALLDPDEKLPDTNPANNLWTR